MYFLSDSAKYGMIAVFFVIVIAIVFVSLYKIRQLRREHLKRIERGVVNESSDAEDPAEEETEREQISLLYQSSVEQLKRQDGEGESAEKELTYLKYDSDSLWEEFEEKSKLEKESDDEEWSSSSGPPLVRFTFYYQQARGHLRLHVHDAECLDAFKSATEKQNLKSRVRAIVLTKSRKQLKQKTRMYDSCTSLEFDEMFIFPLKEQELEGATLNVSIWSIDEFFKEDLIGSTELTISNYDLEDRNFTEEVLKRPQQQVDYDRGYLLLSLCYVASIEKLMVIVMKAKELAQDNAAFEVLSDKLGCSVKVHLVCGGKTTKSYETVKKFGTTNPIFNEMVEFIVTPEQMPEIDLSLSVLMQDSTKGNSECIGRLLLGAHATGDSRNHWDRMLSATGSSGAEWHKLQP